MARKKKAEDGSSAEENQIVVISAWTEWLSSVDIEDRRQIASVLRTVDISSKAGLNAFLLGLLAGVVEGTIHPLVLASARPYVEMLMANTYMMCAANGTPEQAAPKVAGALVDLRKQIADRVRPVLPAYTFGAEEDVLDAVEVGGSR